MPNCKVCGNKAYSDYCFQHKPRKPIGQKADGLKSGKKLDRRSKKRVEQEKEYSKLRKQYLEANPLCERCKKEASEIHHFYQIRYGKFLNDTDQFVGLCAPCHRFTHDNVELSIKEGFLASPEQKAKYLKENLYDGA